MGHTVVMGRLTWESLPAQGAAAAGPQKCRSDAASRLHGRRSDGGARPRATRSTDDETWVIGGAQIYALALPLATRCEVTEVDVDLPREDDDALAPVLDEAWVGTEGTG